MTKKKKMIMKWDKQFIKRYQIYWKISMNVIKLVYKLESKKQKL